MSSVQTPPLKPITPRTPSEPFAPLSAPPTPSPADVPDVPIWRLTVEQYHQMLATGILSDADQVELLEGWLVPKMGKNPPHGKALRRLNRLLQDLIGAAWDTHTQDPILLADSKPEPDLCVVRYDPDDYTAGHPTAEQIGLVVEVSDTTLRHDRGVKLRSYARNGLFEYWIVNLIDRRIERYSEPNAAANPPRYALREDYLPGQTVPVRLAGQAVGEVAVDDVLP